MTKITTLLYLLLFSIAVMTVNATNSSKGLEYLYTLAGKSFNYSGRIPESQILNLCQIQEVAARARKDYDNLFIIQQITVNSYCLKGDIGLAVDKAYTMYDEAKKMDSNIGMALAIQAIGSTYIHSNQVRQAYATLEEAYQLLEDTDNAFLKVRLLVQQIHVCMLLEDTRNMQNHLIEIRKLLDRVEIPNKQDYIFYLQCYQTFYNIAIKDKTLAQEDLENVRNMTPKNHEFDLLYYYLCTRFYALDSEYEKALAYCDSTLNIAVKSGNMNEYKNIMMEKATLLARGGQKEKACSTYDNAKHISDSLNMIRYSKQIDSLHVRYWTDQMAVENTAMHNYFLKWLIYGATSLLIVAAFLMYIARKKNKKLVESRKQLEMARQETEDSIQSKSLFLSNMSHELRTPLNAIVGFADLLSQEAVEDSESKIMFGERIMQNADLLLKLFNDVADLSALKDKNMTFTYDTCDVVALCRNVIDTVENVKQTMATLHFNTTLKELSLYTDSGRLQQVLINLLINATKFTQEGTITLTLEIDEKNQKAVFSVEDTGCGIPKEKQPHIFERFEKLHESVQGAGLGLSICQLIVEHMGGKIWIDTNYSKGARFLFTHPLTNKGTGL